MSFPDNLDASVRTMLTSEDGISRTTHVIEDYSTKKQWLLTPIECERINGFHDNWTYTGMTDKIRNFIMGNALVVCIIECIGKKQKNNWWRKRRIYIKYWLHYLNITHMCWQYIENVVACNQARGLLWMKKEKDL